MTTTSNESSQTQKPPNSFNPKPKTVPLTLAHSQLWVEFWNKVLDKLVHPSFLAFILVLLLLLSGIWVLVSKTQTDVESFWKLILPVVTIYVGYAIGRKSDN